MMIKAATALRNEYNKISELCKKTMEPVFLTKNGEGDLVVMSIEAYELKDELLDLREKLLDAEYDIMSGGRTYTKDELAKKLKEHINGKI